MRNVDYYLSGSMSEPPQGAADHYTEKLLLIDGPAHCYDFGTEQVSEPGQPLDTPQCGFDRMMPWFLLRARTSTRFCLNLQDAWARVLAATPGSGATAALLSVQSVLDTSRIPGSRFSTVLPRPSLPSKRRDRRDRLLVFDLRLTRGHVLQRLRLADVYLDSYPFAGATSLLDPLAIGLPAIVMAGSTFRSLVGAALMRDLRLDELVVNDDQSYIDLAVKIATDRALRESMRQRIVEGMARTPRFLDSRRYGRQVGDMLLKVWDSHPTGA